MNHSIMSQMIKIGKLIQSGGDSKKDGIARACFFLGVKTLTVDDISCLFEEFLQLIEETVLNLELELGTAIVLRKEIETSIVGLEAVIMHGNPGNVSSLTGVRNLVEVELKSLDDAMDVAVNSPA